MLKISVTLQRLFIFLEDNRYCNLWYPEFDTIIGSPNSVTIMDIKNNFKEKKYSKDGLLVAFNLIDDKTIKYNLEAGEYVELINFKNTLLNDKLNVKYYAFAKMKKYIPSIILNNNWELVKNTYRNKEKSVYSAIIEIPESICTEEEWELFYAWEKENTKINKREIYNDIINKYGVLKQYRIDISNYIIENIIDKSELYKKKLI